MEFADVSVVVPTYNRAALLTRALTSIAEQTVVPREIVVIDDGSTDDTEGVIRQFQATCSTSVVYIYKENGGAPSARNAGIRAASCKYVAFQDSDDSWDPGFIETLLDELTVSGAGIAFSSHRVRYLDGSEEIRPLSQVENVKYGLLKENLISTQTALVRADLLADRSFDERLPRLQDWDLWLNLLDRATFSHVAVPLATLYRQPDSLTQNDRNYFVALRLILRKHWRTMIKRPMAFAKHIAKCMVGRPIRTRARSPRI